MSYLELLKLASPEAIVVLTALAVLSIGLTKKGPFGAALCQVVGVVGMAVAIKAIVMLPQAADISAGMMVISPLTSLFKIVCLVLALFTVLLSYSERSLPHRSEYLAILLLATIGLMLLVGSEELLMIFIGLELTGLSLYVMAAFDKTDGRSAEAGLKYFLFGSTASAFTLFGISLIYGMTGTTRLATIAPRLLELHPQPLLIAGIVMTLVGFAFKIAAAPFHLWAPDTYQGAPISSAAFIASASKVASFVVLGKIVLIGFAPFQGSATWHAIQAGWSPVLAAMAALSILVGNFLALVQTSVRRLLAYSAVAHAGYTLIGLVIGGRNGFSATLFYTTIYAITLLGAFGVVGVVRDETGGDGLRNFAGFSARSPWLAGCMAMFMLSLAGLPPLVGFFGKFYLFSAALGVQDHLKPIAVIGPYTDRTALWLVPVALFGSLVSLYYYLMVVKAMFVDQPSAPAAQPLGRQGTPLLQRLTVTALAALVLFLGVMPQTLLARILASLP